MVTLVISNSGADQDIEHVNLYEYFDRIAIIHLPERKDRFASLTSELRGLGIDIRQPKVEVPFAPRPDDACGFPSRGVYGNFLSHLTILRRAREDGLQSVWVLEDDAIFSRRMRREQAALVERLQHTEWGLCFFGHSLTRELAGEPVGLIRPPGDFMWAHCYAVHARALPRIVTYLEQAIELPAHHPSGSKLYIDAAFTLFRKFNPDVVTLVGNPVLSLQKRCPSQLNDPRWFDTLSLTRPLVNLARRMRDEWWRLRT